MASVAPDRIRNIAVTGHGGSGKTTLVETLLHLVGSTTRLGKVDDGTSILDTDPEEHKRRITINMALASFTHEGTKLNLLDTPGFADFAGDQHAALRVADSAVVVVDASAGLQVGTQSVWELLEEAKTPRLVVVGRLDRENADFDNVLKQLREAYGIKVVPLHVPVGAHQDISATIDLLHGQLLKGPKDPIGELPENEKERVGDYQRQLVEAIVETNEDLMNRYLEGTELSYDELRDALHAAVRAGEVVPVVASSSTKRVGFAGLLSAMVQMLPSPAETGAVVGTDANGKEIARKVSPDEKLSAFVFKTLADPFVGKLSYVRVYSGTLHHNTQVYDATKKETERVGQIFFLRGKEQELTEAVTAGDICAVPKLAASNTNSTLSDKDAPIELAPIDFPEPSFSVAIEPSSKADLDKLGTALHKLIDEDPTLHVRRDDATHETILSAVGESAIEVAVHHLKDKFGVQVDTKTPKVPYRESIRAKASAQGRYKRQTGGHGQFGDCKIKVEPLPRGADFEFVDDIFGGSIPRQFIPAVEKGIQETRTRGYLAGYPMVDFRVTVFDGSYHDVDSNELSFKMAGRLAFKDAMTRARPTILEPIMNVEVYAPSDFAGDLMGDLNGRRGRIAGMDTRGVTTIIKAQVPMAEMLSYEQHLTSATGGRGSYHMEYSHYDEVPSHLQTKIIAASKAERAGVEVEEV